MSFSRINTNTQAMQAFTSLKSNSSELASRRQRLATGKRINAAEDDSAGYSIAKKLEAKTRGQSQALSNINDAKSMLTVAEGGLNSQMDILQTMKEKAVQASNDTMGDSEREAIQSQLNELSAEIDDIAKNTDFNGTGLLNGDPTAGDGDAATLGDNGASTSLTFQVGAESGDTFGTEIAKSDAATLGVAGTAEGGGAGDLNVSNIDGGDAAAAQTARNETIQSIDDAIGTVSEQISNLGDSQKRLSFKQENLSTARTNYESARSGIEDADFAKEQMEISKQQILQQAGTATFAQANASSQAVLSFLG